MSIEAVMSRVSQLQAMLASANGAPAAAAATATSKSFSAELANATASTASPARRDAREHCRHGGDGHGQRASRGHALRLRDHRRRARPTGSTRHCWPA